MADELAVARFESSGNDFAMRLEAEKYFFDFSASISVTYTSEIRKVACEGKKLEINCKNRNAYIDVKYALYGRKSKSICYKFYHGLWNKNCKSSKSLSEVKRRCQGKQSCVVEAKNSVFGDPCFLTAKYLTITAVCRGTFNF